MPSRATIPAPAGTTGGNDHDSRHARIRQVLRDAKEPLSVEAVAHQVGVHINTARFHLEALVDAGLAYRQTEVSHQPGRRRILYSGAPPQPAPGRAQGYRLLATMLAGAIATHPLEAGDDMYQAGVQWGRYLTTQPAPFEVCDEDEIGRRILDKLDAAWFVTELCPGPVPQLVLHNCPFIEAARQAPAVVCQLHAGMINGALEELRCRQRVTKLEPQAQPGLCRALLGPLPGEAVTQVPLQLPDRGLPERAAPDAAGQAGV